jgi:very-short-patch-repair endonuclease
MRGQVRSVDETVARIAGQQHGVITRAQLLRAGLGEGVVDRRVAKGSLIRVHRGVYRVGHRAPSLEASYLAAVLACGDEAVLSGYAAAHIFGLVKGKPPRPEVSSPRHKRIKGIATRRIRLDGRENTVYRGIPVTTVPRAVVDLAPGLEPEDLARTCHEAAVKHRVGAPEVEAVLERRRSGLGREKLHAIYRGDTRILLSRLEEAFVTQLRRAQLPLPQTNRKNGAHWIDCRWPAHRLTVELDSYRYHHTRHAWEKDRRREREARARGDEFRRFTYDDVTEDREQTLAELQALLQQA